ncbi:hypothetical protein LJC27_05270 [Christensenellaceae bacterium OttesenSCG-928-M15]|nr:hypothetical protein [Christensenellaceae bacterium OttesenSCG-928-M15]
MNNFVKKKISSEKIKKYKAGAKEYLLNPIAIHISYGMIGNTARKRAIIGDIFTNGQVYWKVGFHE